jgi:hypothetical protein
MHAINEQLSMEDRRAIVRNLENVQSATLKPFSGPDN